VVGALRLKDGDCLWSAPRPSSPTRSASRYPRLVSAGRRRCLFVSGEPSQANIAGPCALRAPGLYIGFGAGLSRRYAYRLFLISASFSLQYMRFKGHQYIRRTAKNVCSKEAWVKFCMFPVRWTIRKSQQKEIPLSNGLLSGSGFCDGGFGVFGLFDCGVKLSDESPMPFENIKVFLALFFTQFIR